MNKKLKKLLCGVISAAMVSASVVLPTTAGATDWSADAGSWKFDFGSADNVAEGYIGVSADTQYNATQGYGFLGLENGFATDWLADGWTMTQGYDLTLENGARSTVASADDDFVACTYDETIGSTGMVSPIRFAMNSPESTYYNVKITLQRADVSKEANVSLFTERRHQHLLNEPIPEEGLTYECNVFVHNWWDKNSGEKHDTMLNISAVGENVAISSIEVTKPAEQGKTLFVLTDSTGCEQGAAIPYFPLDHCQGVGSAMAKYLGKDWALVNEGQSGLSSAASIRHFENCINDVKEGDVVWFEFGHNDDKVTGDPATNGYNSTLENYYTQVTAKGASFVVVSPIERKRESQFNTTDNTWNHTLNHYSTAAKAFVDAKIAGGAKNIAFVDVNEMSLSFLNDVTDEINGKYSYGWQSANFYYFLNDYTHPNDYGADNFAKLFVNGANDIITAAAAADADDAVKAQATVLSSLLDGQRGGEAERVPESIYGLGKVPNSAYPTALTKVVYYDFPWLLKKVTWNDDGSALSVTAEPVACNKEIPSLYSKGVIEIFNADGTSKGKITTDEFLDKLNGEGILEFTDTTVKYDATAGDTYKAYMIDSDIGVTDETIVSNTLTEKDNYDINKYLIQGSAGTENVEDFSTYSTVAVGSTIIGTNGWSGAGDANMVLGEEDGKNFAKVTHASGSSHYIYKSLTEPVSTGKVLAQFDVRYNDGVINFEFTDGSKAPNSFPPLILPLTVKAVNSEAGVYLDGELVSAINAKEWTTIQYIIDLDYGTHTAKVNGSEVTKDIPQMQKNEANTPSKLGAIGFVETTKSAAVNYDITNMVIASLNVDELPDRTIKAKTIADEGTVTVLDADGQETVLPVTAKMNTFYTLKATPAKGYKFVSWNDVKTDEVVSYVDTYKFRLHSDVDVYAEFIKTAEPDMVFNLVGNGTVDDYIVSSGSKTNGIWSLDTSGSYAFMTVADTAIKYLKLTGMSAHDGNFYLFTANDSAKSASFTGKNSEMSVEGAGIYKFAMAPVADYSNEGTKHRGSNDVSVVLCNNDGAEALMVAYKASDFTLAVNGTTVHTFANAAAAQKWTDVKAVINEDHTKAIVTFTYSDGSEPTTHEVDLTAAGAYNTLKMNTTAWGTVALDDIQLYEGEEYIASDETNVSMKYITDDGKVKITSNKEIPAVLVAASYDKTTGVLNKVDVNNITVVNGAVRVAVETAENSDVKIMLWNSVENMVPLTETVSASSEVSAE